MKKTLFLFLAISLVALSAEMTDVSNKKVKAQVKQPKQGEPEINVYARPQGKDETSVFLEIQNQGARYSNYQVDPNRATADAFLDPIRDIRFRGSYNRAVRAPSIQELFGSERAALGEKSIDEWQASGGNRIAVAPTATGVMRIDTSTFATSWDGKFDPSVEQTKDGFVVNWKDKAPATPEFAFFGRIDINAGIDYVAKQKIEVEVKFGEKVITKTFSEPIVLPPLELNSETAKSAITLPYTLHPGQNALGTINADSLRKTHEASYGKAYKYIDAPPVDSKEPLQTVASASSYNVIYYGIDWRHAGRLNEDTMSGAKRILQGALEFADKQYGTSSENRLVNIKVPADAKPTDSIGIVGINAFGEKFLDTKIENTRILPENAASSCNFEGPKAAISSTNKYVFAGRNICVCGCFSSESFPLFDTVFSAFTLDGKQINPIAFSSTTTTFLIPPDATPGLHRLGYADAAGNTKTLDFRVLQLDGEINQNELLRNQSTMMTLTILGTGESLPLRITNTTPGIITITGGDVQTTNTSGGAPNLIKRLVNGIKVGDFDIQYELDEAPCPCLENK